MGFLESLNRAIQVPPTPETFVQPRDVHNVRKTAPLTSIELHEVKLSRTTDSMRSDDYSQRASDAPSTPTPEEKIETRESVEVQVGSDESLKIFVVNKSLLCEASAYFRLRFAPESRFKEQAVIFKGLEPLAFEIFLQWVKNPAPTIAYDPDGLPQEPWLSNAATAWLLGKTLRCSDEFDKYALSQFIQNCAFMAFGPWDWLEKQKGSLCRFSDHWVAWNYQFAGPEPNEYSGLRATRVPIRPNRDPRTYDIEHWYSECGEYMRPRCLHDPITRLEKAEEANRPKPVPPAEWGHYTEFRREYDQRKGRA